MLCWRCGAQIQGEVCPVCGCRQNSRQAAATASGAALRSVYDRVGAQRMLTDSAFFARCLDDIFPHEKAEQQRFSTVMQTSAGPRIYDLLRRFGGLSGSDCQELVRLIQAESGMPEGLAQGTLGDILDMIGCDNPFAVNPQFIQDLYAGTEQPRNAAPVDPWNPMAGKTVEQPGGGRQSPGVVQVLAVKEESSILDTTGGMSYWGSFGLRRKGKGRLLVRTDGVAWHVYTDRRHPPDKRACSNEPDFFIPGSEINSVLEHSLAFLHEFTIITRDGHQYRVEGKSAAASVTDVVNAIKSLITT